MLFYSAQTGGFYDDAIHGADLPPDAVEIDPATHAALLDGQAAGLMIVAVNDGRPILIDRPAPTPEEALASERASMRASRFQARAALHIAGLLPQIEAAVAGADPIVQIAWADAAEWRRDSPALTALASAVGLDDDAIDQLFRNAMQIAA